MVGVRVGFQVLDVLCDLNLGGHPNETTEREYVLVSKT